MSGADKGCGKNKARQGSPSAQARVRGLGPLLVATEVSEVYSGVTTTIITTAAVLTAYSMSPLRGVPH